MYMWRDTLHEEWTVIVKSYKHVLQFEIVLSKLYLIRVCVIMNWKHMYHMNWKKKRDDDTDSRPVSI